MVLFKVNFVIIKKKKIRQGENKILMLRIKVEIVIDREKGSFKMDMLYLNKLQVECFCVSVLF